MLFDVSHSVWIAGRQAFAYVFSSECIHCGKADLPSALEDWQCLGPGPGSDSTTEWRAQELESSQAIAEGMNTAVCLGLPGVSCWACES